MRDQSYRIHRVLKLFISFLIVIFLISDQHESRANSRQNRDIVTRSFYQASRNGEYTEKNSIYAAYLQSLSQGDLEKSYNLISELSQVAGDYLDLIIYYEKARLLLATGKKREALDFWLKTRESKEFEALRDSIQETLLNEYASYQDDEAFNAFLDHMMDEIPEWRMNPDMIALSITGLSGDHPNRDQALLKYWIYADITENQLTPESLIARIKSNPAANLDVIRDHFLRQYSYRNFTYLINEIPPLLPDYVADSEGLEKIKGVYFKSMIRKRHYSNLLDLINSPDFRQKYAVSDFEARTRSIQLYVRRGSVTKAKEVLSETVRKYPDNNYFWKYLEIANYHFQRKQFVEAEKYYVKAILKPPGRVILEDIQWKLLWIYHARQNPEGIRQVFQWTESHDFSEPGVAAKFCYWRDKMAQPEGESLKCYQRYPTTYYGFRAYQKAAVDKPVGAISFKTAQPADIRELRAEEVEFLQFLDMVYQNGDTELGDILTRRYLSKNRSPEFFIYLSATLFEARRYHLLQLMVDIYFREMTRSYTELGNTLLMSAYPVGYLDEIREYNDQTIVPDFLALSVLREESKFKPDVISVAGAIGLMQLMPKTAKYIGETIRVNVDIGQIPEPELNIQLGTAYLKRLMKRYNGNYYLALAAYNGGPTNVNRWLKRLSSDDMDYFVETIPFDETKNYVRRVIRSFFVYSQIYSQ